MSKTSDFCNVTPRAAELNAALTAARAEAAMLREALEVARVVGEIQFPRCVLAHQARKQIDAALSTSSSGWLDQKIAEATSALREDRDGLAAVAEEIKNFCAAELDWEYFRSEYKLGPSMSDGNLAKLRDYLSTKSDPAAILSAHDARIRAEARKSALLEAAVLAGDKLSQSAGDIYRRLLDLANEESDND